MSNCCTNTTNKNTPSPCPECQTFCKPVTRQTMLHQLLFPYNMQLKQGQYYYCHTQECNTAYFSLNGTFNKRHLKNYHKIQQNWLCYCFDISAQDYQNALINGNSQAIKNFVNKQTKAALCACEIQNPSGQCCLAKFKRLEREQQIQ